MVEEGWNRHHIVRFVSRQLRKRENCLDSQVALPGLSDLVERDVKVLAADTPLVVRDTE